MNHTFLIVFGIAGWLFGLAGLLWISRTTQSDVPLWLRFLNSVRFKVSGRERIEELYALWQVLGLFWILAGIGFWLVDGVVDPASIATLVALVYCLPVVFLASAIIHRKD